ncbi:MAG: sulfite exporter TauE/SafE family protein [Anaerolineae bacterium]
MALPWYVYLLALGAGILAGIINTLAGSGSLITLPMLMFLGLPSPVANATNRVGVVLQNVVGIATLRRGGKLRLDGTGWLLAPAVLGGLLGALIAVKLDKRTIDICIAVLMAIMLVVVVLDPQRWLREHSRPLPARPSVPMLLLFFAIGVYGGFIQAGVGIFLLAAMVLGVGYSLVDANGIKLVLVLAFTLVAIVVFAAGGQIVWGIGVLMAAGQGIGAWIGATFAVRAKNANVWIRRLIIAVLLVSMAKLLGLLPL